MARDGVGETAAEARAGSDGPERLCYDGERVVASATLGAGWAAVTSHRVLAYDPSADGRRFAAVQRPNVGDVAVDASGDRRLLGWGLRAGVYGLAALGGGVGLRAVDLASTLSVGGGVASAPVGGVLAVIETLASAFAALATLLLGGGALAVAVGVALLVRYRRTRRPALVIDRYGDDPVRLSVDRADGERAAAALSAALSGDRGPPRGEGRPPPTDQ
jgi:hypothetical protein